LGYSARYVRPERIGRPEVVDARRHGIPARLGPLADRVDALDPARDVPDSDLDDLRRLSLSHAVAAQALRGLVETMLKRRGKLTDVSAIKTGGEE